MAEPMILEVLSNLKSRVATNETNISTNAANIETNKGLFDTHTADDNRHWTTADRQNFDRVVHFKGYFTTEAKLKEAYPTANLGDYAIVGKTDTVWAWDDDTNKWLNTTEQGVVISVNGATGEVVLDKTSVGLENVDNTSDIDKPISTAQQIALDDKVDRKKITESEADSLTLRAGIYDLFNVEKTISNFTSRYWTIIVGEQSENIPLIYGDINRDGIVDQADYDLLSEFIEETKTPTEEQFLLSDVNKDGKVNGKDWDKVYKYIKGTEDEIIGTPVEANGEISEGQIFTSTQIWINYGAGEAQHMFVRHRNGEQWSDFIEIITSIQLSTLQALVEEVDGKVDANTKSISTNKGTMDSHIEDTDIHWSDADRTSFNLTKHFKGYYETVLALAEAIPTGVKGDYAVVGATFYIWNSENNSWVQISGGGGTGAVSSVNGLTGDVVLTKTNIGLENVDNTADADKNVKSAGSLTNKKNINGLSFDGTTNVSNFGIANISSNDDYILTASIQNIVLEDGAIITLQFVEDVYAPDIEKDISLQINEGEVYPICNISSGRKMRGESTEVFSAGETYEFSYKNGNWSLVGGLNTGVIRDVINFGNGASIFYDTYGKTFSFIIDGNIVMKLDSSGNLNVEAVFENSKITYPVEEFTKFNYFESEEIVVLPRQVSSEESGQYAFGNGEDSNRLNVNLDPRMLYISDSQTGENLIFNSNDGITYIRQSWSQFTSKELGEFISFNPDSSTRTWTDLLGYFIKVRKSNNNLSPENIKSGVNVFGIVGDYEGEMTANQITKAENLINKIFPETEG